MSQSKAKTKATSETTDKPADMIEKEVVQAAVNAVADQARILKEGTDLDSKQIRSLVLKAFMKGLSKKLRAILDKKPADVDASIKMTPELVSLIEEIELEAGLRDWARTGKRKLGTLGRKFQHNKAVKRLWKTLSLPLPLALKQFVKFFRKDIDDAMDEVLEHVAPKVIKAVMNNEIQEAVDKFAEKKGRQPTNFERKLLIRRVHDQVEHKITEETIMHVGKGVIHGMNPKTIYKYVKEMVKIHGWKIGVAIAIVETIENAVIPAIMIGVGMPSLAWVGSAFPTEVTIYPLIFKKIFKVNLPKELSRGEMAGHVGWYCDNFPDERMCREEVYATS